MTTTPAGMKKIDGSPGGELLKQDSLGRVRTPLEKREAIVRAFVRPQTHGRRNFYSVKVSGQFWGRSAGFMMR